jgi:hypothetical protein
VPNICRLRREANDPQPSSQPDLRKEPRRPVTFALGANVKRLVIAFALAPAAVPLLIVLVFVLGGDFGVSYVFAGPIAIFAYAVTLLLGLPTFLWFRRRRWLSFWHFAIGGAVLGLAPLAFFAVIAAPLALSFLAVQPLGYAAIDLVSACVFWAIGNWRNSQVSEHQYGRACSAS